jgi:hypothetical protein
MKKYLKYKKKYLQYAGSEVSSINYEHRDFLNRYDTNIIDIAEYIEKRNNDFIDYIYTKRTEGTEGFKIMLIIGAIPEQQDKFNIPDNYIPIYLEKDYKFTYYSKSIEIINRIKTESFDSYPLLICDLFTLEERFPDIKYDLIIFDGGVCFHLELNVEKILGLFRLTYDNNSIIIFDNMYNMVLIDRKFDVDLIDLESDNLPKVYKYIDTKKSRARILESEKISSLYKLWFVKHFDSSKLLFNDRIFFALKNYFQPTITHNPRKTIIIYTEINPYLKDSSQMPYLFCCQTKNY